MRVLMITQKIDPDDQVLSFAIGWIKEIAARVEHLHVLCLEQHPMPLPSNVTVWSMGKELGRNRIRELIRLYSALVRVLPQVDVIFTHMVPRYAALASPLILLSRKPHLLWYTHCQIDIELKLALRVCTAVATAVPDSFPIPHPKVHSLGHGINTTLFVPDPACRRDEPPVIVHVARLMPIKRQATLIRALVSVPDVRAVFVGETVQSTDYLEELKKLAAQLGVTDRIEFAGRKRAEVVHDLYVKAAAAVNLSPPGLFDKAALEAMLSGTPTIVSNAAFDPLLDAYVDRLRIKSPEDVEGLVERLKGLLQMTETERQQMTSGIAERTRSHHSLNRLMDRLVALMESL